MNPSEKELFVISGADFPELNGKLVHMFPGKVAERKEDDETVVVKLSGTRYEIPARCLSPRGTPDYANL